MCCACAVCCCLRACVCCVCVCVVVWLCVCCALCVCGWFVYVCVVCVRVLVCPRGPMDKASAYEAGDCGFESRRRLSFLSFFFVVCVFFFSVGVCRCSTALRSFVSCRARQPSRSDSLLARSVPTARFPAHFLFRRPRDVCLIGDALRCFVVFGSPCCVALLLTRVAVRSCGGLVARAACCNAAPCVSFRFVA